MHCGKGSRLLVEFLLTELSAKNSLVCSSGPNGSSSESRECVALAAGWSLGMLLLARGRSPSGTLAGEHGHISDLRVEDRLQQCIDGGRRPQSSGIFDVRFDCLCNNSLSLLTTAYLTSFSLLIEHLQCGSGQSKLKVSNYAIFSLQYCLSIIYITI